MHSSSYVSESRNNDGALTGIRFFAALHVVIFHYGREALPFQGEWAHEWARLGHVAVSFFFVLSGYILAIAYAGRPWSEDKSLARRFLWARFARIYPVYLLAMVMAVSLYVHYSPFDSETTVAYIGKICLNLFMVQSWVPGMPMAINGPAWSLSVEVFFYLSFPLFFPWMRTWSRKKLLIVTGLIAVLGGAFAYAQVHLLFPGVSSKVVREFRIYFPPWHWPGFALGVCTGLLTSKGFFDRWPKPIMTMLVLGLGGLYFCSPKIFTWTNRLAYESLGMGFHWSTLAHNGLMALPFALFMVGLHKGHTFWNRAWGNRVLMFLGNASYAFYLLQYPVWTFLRFEVFKPLNITEPSTKFYLNLVVLMMVSSLVYRYVEKPLRTWLVARGPLF